MDFKTLQLNINAFIPEISLIVAQTQINLVYQRLLREFKWNSLKKQEFLATVDDYATGTVAVTLGSTTVTGTGTTFTAAMVGRKIRVGTDKNYYEIGAYVSGTEITLADAYVGATASGAVYKIWQNVYSLATDLREIIAITHNQKLNEVSSTYLALDDPLRESMGTPTRYMMQGETAAGVKQIELWKVPDAVYLIPYTYLKTVSNMSADADTPVIPDDVVFYETLVDCYSLMVPRNSAYVQMIPVMQAKASQALYNSKATEIRLEPEEKQKWLESETALRRLEGGRA